MASVPPSTSLAKWGQIAPLLFCGVAPHPPGQAGRPPCVPVPGGVRIRPPTSAEIEFVISLLQSLSCSSFAVSHRRRRPRSRKVKTSGGQRNATLCEFATELTRDGGKEARQGTAPFAFAAAPVHRPIGRRYRRHFVTSANLSATTVSPKCEAD